MAMTTAIIDVPGRPRAGAASAKRARSAVRGLIDPRNERDSCGVGFIVNMDNVASHRIVEDGLKIVRNLTHRGAVGADPLVGDGAGMLVQMPHAFFSAEAERLGFALPAPGQYAVGVRFHAAGCRDRAPTWSGSSRKPSREEGQTLLGWRDVPVDNSCLSKAPEVDRHRAGAPSGFHRPRRRRRRRRGFRAQALHRAQGDLGAHLFGATAASRTTSTSCRCRAARSSTRACSSPTSSAPTTATCTIRASSRRWRWSTSASRPTPSRRGVSPTPTGWSATTARSTPCAATSTGWRRGRRASSSDLLRRRHHQAVADLL